ncbi:hypothetical protein ALC60_08315 [Trachymyrmex zeteki]|uniref:Uncharacterized protein n=1 Tax=Mycetomoellerius zeteki TaxID=64791 RepID=A0A151WXM4_9HYME|nr:hypothetical protein ALC60_08315 [Trachymyrmex zeteki]
MEVYKVSYTRSVEDKVCKERNSYRKHKSRVADRVVLVEEDKLFYVEHGIHEAYWDSTQVEYNKLQNMELNISLVYN